MTIEQAIEIIESETPQRGTTTKAKQKIDAFDMAVSALRLVGEPTAEWTTDSYGYIICGHCGNEALWDTDYGQRTTVHCPHCGWKMEGME